MLSIHSLFVHQENNDWIDNFLIWNEKKNCVQQQQPQKLNEPNGIERVQIVNNKRTQRKARCGDISKRNANMATQRRNKNVYCKKHITFIRHSKILPISHKSCFEKYKKVSIVQPSRRATIWNHNYCVEHKVWRIMWVWKIHDAPNDDLWALFTFASIFRVCQCDFSMPPFYHLIALPREIDNQNESKFLKISNRVGHKERWELKSKYRYGKLFLCIQHSWVSVGVFLFRLWEMFPGIDKLSRELGRLIPRHWW